MVSRWQARCTEFTDFDYDVAGARSKRGEEEEEEERKVVWIMNKGGNDFSSVRILVQPSFPVQFPVGAALLQDKTQPQGSAVTSLCCPSQLLITVQRETFHHSTDMYQIIPQTSIWRYQPYPLISQDFPHEPTQGKIPLLVAVFVVL